MLCVYFVLKIDLVFKQFQLDEDEYYYLGGNQIAICSARKHQLFVTCNNFILVTNTFLLNRKPSGEATKERQRFFNLLKDSQVKSRIFVMFPFDLLTNRTFT